MAEGTDALRKELEEEFFAAHRQLQIAREAVAQAQRDVDAALRARNSAARALQAAVGFRLSR